MLKHMVHNPYNASPQSRFMREGRCSKNFPKPFRLETGSFECDYNVSYRRRSPEIGGEFEGRVRKSKVTGTTKIILDNLWVVPHSLYLLRKFRTHMNVGLCISRVGSIKYLFENIC